MAEFIKERKEVSHFRHSSLYRKQYHDDFVDKWDELIDWDGRSKGEGDFFVRELQKRGAKKVLDVATGTGFHSVQLLKAGFEVHSADGQANMLERAFYNARRQNLILRTIHADWRQLSNNIHEKYDAIICLGNSFTHLFDEKDRRKAMAEFYSVLKSDGVLILDQRNYDGMLEKGYSSKHKFYYTGDIVAEPESVEEDMVRFKYQFKDKSTYHLNFFPLKKNYMHNLLNEAGFRDVKTYADFQEVYKQEDPDFFIHVAGK